MTSLINFQKDKKMATAPSIDSIALDPPPPYPGQERVRAKDIVRDQPCPNGCETGDLSQYELKKHLPVCPLQLVECEFVQSGCDVRVPRKDLAKHMTESAQHHLMSATLLNLRLTRELQTKIAEKDQQIIELQQQVKQLEQRTDHSSDGFISHNLTLTNFKNQQARGGRGVWYSDEFSDQLGGFKFNLQIDTNGYKESENTHLTAWLHINPHKYGNDFNWPIKCIVYLKMLNQLEDYNHHVVIGQMSFFDQSSTLKTKMIGKTSKFFPKDDLCSGKDKETQYLCNDSLHFRLHLKTDYFWHLSRYN